MERGPGGLRPTRRGRHHDVPHEPTSVASGLHPVLHVDQPGRRSSATSTSSSPASSATRCTRSARSSPRRRSAGSRAIGRPSMPGPTWAMGSTRTAAAPATRWPSASTRSSDREERGMRSHLLEGKVRHRRSRPVDYATGARCLLRRAGPRRAGRGGPLDPARQPEPAGTRSQFRDADHWPEPATDLRATVLDHLRAEGEDPTGWRITLVTNLRVLGYVFNPASFYLCRDERGRPARGGGRGAQHAPGAPPVHAPVAGPRTAVRRLDGQGLLRVPVHRHGGPVHRARAGRSLAPPDRDQRAPGRRAAPRPRASCSSGGA